MIGRKSDTIVTGGENVAPAEVEAVLEEHPARRGGRRLRPPAPGVGRVGDRARGAATASTRPSAAELREHVAERLAGYKVPKSFELVTRLPRTPSGKLLRRELT